MKKEKKVDRIDDLFVLYERIFSLGGVWPSKPSYVKFTIYCTYYVILLAMAYVDLFDILGNLELMVMNIVETTVYTITFTMVLVIRFSGMLKRVIYVTKKEIENYRFENDDEREIYHAYHYVSKMFFKISNIGMLITVTLSYMRPVIIFIIDSAYNKNNNETDANPYVLPLRLRTFYELTNTRDYILFYIYLLPISYMSTCHMTAICVLVNLVFHICANLEILSYRIRNIDLKSEKEVRHRLRSFIQIHMKIIWFVLKRIFVGLLLFIKGPLRIFFFVFVYYRMAQALDEAFNIVLLDELLGNSIALAISMYYVLVSYDTAELATCCSFVFFGLTALLMLYGFCYIGEQLTQQSMNVLDAYYECNWQEMSASSKKSLLICMIRARAFLHLTAGKFYIFSLNGFTDVSINRLKCLLNIDHQSEFYMQVLKTSMAYLSLLRTVM